MASKDVLSGCHGMVGRLVSGTSNESVFFYFVICDAAYDKVPNRRFQFRCKFTSKHAG